MSMNLRAGILGLVIVSASPLTASEPVSIHVSPNVSFAPAAVRIRIKVEPDADNRVMEVVADSDAFYRSSTIQLDGDQAPMTTLLQLRGLPSGEYDITATLKGSDGRPKGLARTHVHIIGSEPTQ